MANRNSLRGGIIARWIESGSPAEVPYTDLLQWASECDEALRERALDPAPRFREFLQNGDHDALKNYLKGQRFQFGILDETGGRASPQTGRRLPETPTVIGIESLRVCLRCGRLNFVDGVFCSYCGGGMPRERSNRPATEAATGSTSIGQLSERLESSGTLPSNEERMSSVFIVVNAASGLNQAERAKASKEITELRVRTGTDIQAPGRFQQAKELLRPGIRIVMHCGGNSNWREQYGAGQLVAAGTVKAVGLTLTEEDRQSDIHAMTERLYPSKHLVGKALYEFPRGLARQPLPKEGVPYNPVQGDNYIEIKPNDPRFTRLHSWWKANCGSCK